MSRSFEHVLENSQIYNFFLHLSGNFQLVSGFFFNEDENNFFFSYTATNSEGLKKIWLVPEIVKFTWREHFFYRTTQKSSRLLKNFPIAMLPCYQGFSISEGIEGDRWKMRCDRFNLSRILMPKSYKFVSHIFSPGSLQIVLKYSDLNCFSGFCWIVGIYIFGLFSYNKTYWTFLVCT